MEFNLEQLRTAIIAQTKDKWLEFHVLEMGRTIRVPQGAFEQWSVHHSQGGHLATPWKPISPVGVKQGADDPFHTDWMLGAGLEPWDMKEKGSNLHWEALSEMAYREKAKIEEKLLNHQASILLNGPEVFGRIIQPVSPDGNLQIEDELPPVLVIKTASAEWLETAWQVLNLGGAVIVERGGEMAHLITELRQHGGPVLRIDNAKNLYPDNSVVMVSPTSGTIRLIEYDFKPNFPILSSLHREVVTNTINQKPIEVSNTPKEKSKWTLQIRGDKPFHGEHFSYLEFGSKIEGRNYKAYSRIQFSDNRTETGVLCVSIFEVANAPKERKTVYSNARVWSGLEVRDATREALLLLHPEEAYDSSESQKIRKDIQDRIMLEFHEKVKHLSDDEFVEQVKRTVIEYLEERPELIDLYDDEVADIVANYRYNFRKYDDEFKFRGLSIRVLDIECELEDLNLSSPQV